MQPDLSHLQHFVHEAGIPDGDICSCGLVISMVDYIIVREEDKANVCNVKVIPNVCQSISTM